MYEGSENFSCRLFSLTGGLCCSASVFRDSGSVPAELIRWLKLKAALEHSGKVCQAGN